MWPVTVDRPRGLGNRLQTRGAHGKAHGRQDGNEGPSWESEVCQAHTALTGDRTPARGILTEHRRCETYNERDKCTHGKQT